MEMITDSAPKIEESAVPMSVVEFLDAVEEPLKDQYLPEARGKTIYASLLGTAADLSPVDNVKVCHKRGGILRPHGEARTASFGLGD